MPAPGRHRGGAAAARASGSGCRGCACVYKASQAAKKAGWTAARAERTKRTRFRKDVPVHAAFQFVPFAAGKCGYMGKEAVRFVSRLGDITSESGRIPKGAYVHWEMQLLSVTAQQGMLRCTAGVGWSSRVSRVCAMTLVLQCQC